MRTTIVVTDLTRMSGSDVCIAGIDETNYQSIRPILEYGVHGISQRNLFLENNMVIFPRVKISFNSQKVKIDPPHIEDLGFDPQSVTYKGIINENNWEKILIETSFNSVQDIFSNQLKEYHGYIVEPGTNTRSLGTVSQIKIEYINFELATGGRIKSRLSFMDKIGHKYKYVPINDFTFLTLAKSKLMRCIL